MAAEQFLLQYANLIPQWLLMEPLKENLPYIITAANIPFLPGVEKPPQGNFPEEIVQPEIKQFVTAAMLKEIMPNIPMAEMHARIINALAPRYGLDNAEVFPEFIAQVAHESSEFRKKDESLAYSWNRLREVFPKYFPNDGIAKSYAFKAEKIANRVYANRMGNGPESSGDGYRNRGGGYIMLTGDIWELYALYIGKTVEETQRLVRSSSMIEYALDSAMWYFAVYKSLNDEAARDEFRKITIAINGGTIGAEDREIYYRRALKVFSNN